MQIATTQLANNRKAQGEITDDHGKRKTFTSPKAYASKGSDFDQRPRKQLLHIAHKPQPLDAFNEHRIVLAVLHYCSQRHQEPITIPGLSRQRGISSIHIETAFEISKGKTTHQALLDYRLNRLCDLFIDPSDTAPCRSRAALSARP